MANMKIQVHANEMQRMMKIMVGCIDPKSTTYNNVVILHQDDKLKVQGSNGVQFIEMSCPLMGDDPDSFAVDAKNLSNICGQARGMLEISFDGKICTVKGAGRARMPAVQVRFAPPAEMDPGKERTIIVSADALKAAWGQVAYAISADDARMILTGVLLEIVGGQMRLVGLDGFQLSYETIAYMGDDAKIVVPYAMMKRICDCIGNDAGEKVTIVTDGARVRLSADGVEITGPLLQGEYIDYQKLLPSVFSTEAEFDMARMVELLKTELAISGKTNMVKLVFRDGMIHLSNRSEEVDFEGEIPVEMRGDDLAIAFNDKYLKNALDVIASEKATIHLNSPRSPAIITGKDESGVHLLLPVRLNV